MKKFFTLIFLSFLSGSWLLANNLQLSNISVASNNTAESYAMLQFDISWENSWRTTDAPNNWDAAWLFVKYKSVIDGNWYHATLNLTPANHNTGSQAGSATINVAPGGTGVTYYRSANGTGTFSSTSVQLRWEYGTNGITDFAGSIADIQVFGIEMVYVPQGAFYVGSGGSEYNSFYAGGTSNLPYFISSENAITVGPSQGNLYYLNNCTINYTGNDRIGPIPSAFPKGYNAFYCMKYEITQGQYVDFLNTLTCIQRMYRFSTPFNFYGSFITSVNDIYGCDGNINNILNEIDDCQWIACNYLSWADGTAYSDWAGLSPMTELEYEKACRGPLTPVANEYAWGTTNIILATAITDSGTAQETTTPINANSFFVLNDLQSEIQRPLRAGIFARPGSTREQSGSTFYGIMDFSGNLTEQTVNLSTPEGRTFTGINGDGLLDANGNADTPNWPGTNGIGSGSRGGAGNFNFEFNSGRTSDRCGTNYPNNSRYLTNGFRCVIRDINP